MSESKLTNWEVVVVVHEKSGVYHAKGSKLDTVWFHLYVKPKKQNKLIKKKQTNKYWQQAAGYRNGRWQGDR